MIKSGSIFSLTKISNGFLLNSLNDNGEIYEQRFISSRNEINQILIDKLLLFLPPLPSKENKILFKIEITIGNEVLLLGK